MEIRKVFSIIVPIYNCENYLSQCIESILSQFYFNFELILINDGSTDSSLNICLNYKKKDSRIVIVDKKNGGASSARNEGIKIAVGEYLIFIDSDDYIENQNFLQEIFSRIKQNSADIILYGCKNYNVITNYLSTSRGNYDIKLIEKFEFINTIHYLVCNNLFPGSAWIFAVKNNIIKKNQLFFKTNYIAEDIDWVTKIFNKILKIDAVNDVYYVYRKNQINSVTGNARIIGIESIMSIIDNWYPKLNKKDDISRFLLHNLGYYYFTCLVIFDRLPESDKKLIISKLKRNFIVTQFVITKKLKLLRFLCQIFGFQLTSFFVSKLYFIRENKCKF